MSFLPYNDFFKLSLSDIFCKEGFSYVRTPSFLRVRPLDQKEYSSWSVYVHVVFSKIAEVYDCLFQFCEKTPFRFEISLDEMASDGLLRRPQFSLCFPQDWSDKAIFDFLESFELALRSLSIGRGSVFLGSRPIVGSSYLSVQNLEVEDSEILSVDYNFLSHSSFFSKPLKEGLCLVEDIECLDFIAGRLVFGFEEVENFYCVSSSFHDIYALYRSAQFLDIPFSMQADGDFFKGFFPKGYTDVLEKSWFAWKELFDCYRILSVLKIGDDTEGQKDNEVYNFRILPRLSDDQPPRIIFENLKKSDAFFDEWSDILSQIGFPMTSEIGEPYYCSVFSRFLLESFLETYNDDLCLKPTRYLVKKQFSQFDGAFKQPRTLQNAEEAQIIRAAVARRRFRQDKQKTLSPDKVKKMRELGIVKVKQVKGLETFLKPKEVEVGARLAEDPVSLVKDLSFFMTDMLKDCGDLFSSQQKQHIYALSQDLGSLSMDPQTTKLKAFKVLSKTQGSLEKIITSLNSCPDKRSETLGNATREIVGRIQNRISYGPPKVVRHVSLKDIQRMH